MKEKDQEVINLEYSYGAFLKLLEFIYKFEIEMDGEEVMELLYLAGLYQMEVLKKQCTDYIILHLSKDNCCMILNGSVEQNNEELIKMSTKTILKHIDSTVRFLDLSSVALKKLISMDEFSIPEKDKFLLCDDWTRAVIRKESRDTPEEYQHLMLKFLPVIRFSLMSTFDLASYVYPTSVLGKDDMMKFMLHSTNPKMFPLENTKENKN